MSRLQFVADHRDVFEVKWLCEIVEIQVAHAQDNTYGAPRITAELNDGAPEADRVNHKRVARVMRANGIAGYRRRRRVTTTVADPADQKVPDLLKRDFTAAQINSRYVGDITYLPLATGDNLYLATVIDCCSRRIAIADHMRTELVEDAVKAAAALRGAWPVLCFMPITEQLVATLRNRCRRGSARECARVRRPMAPAGLDGSRVRRGDRRWRSRDNGDQILGGSTGRAHRCVAFPAPSPGGVHCPARGARRVVPCQGVLVFAGGFGGSGWSGDVGLRWDARQGLPARSGRRSGNPHRCCRGVHCEVA